MIWDCRNHEVNVKQVEVQFIHNVVFDKQRKKQFTFTMVYGLNKVNERDDMGSKLRCVKDGVVGPWVICGDFNAIQGLNERIGGNPVANFEVKPMLSFTTDCEVEDLKATGSFFTWNNKQDVEHIIYRLGEFFS